MLRNGIQLFKFSWFVAHFFFFFFYVIDHSVLLFVFLFLFCFFFCFYYNQAQTKVKVKLTKANLKLHQRRIASLNQKKHKILFLKLNQNTTKCLMSSSVETILTTSEIEIPTDKDAYWGWYQSSKMWTVLLQKKCRDSWNFCLETLIYWKNADFYSIWKLQSSCLLWCPNFKFW